MPRPLLIRKAEATLPHVALCLVDAQKLGLGPLLGREKHINCFRGFGRIDGERPPSIPLETAGAIVATFPDPATLDPSTLARLGNVRADGILLRFAGRISPARRKTRFRLRATLYRARLVSRWVLTKGFRVASTGHPPFPGFAWRNGTLPSFGSSVRNFRFLGRRLCRARRSAHSRNPVKWPSKSTRFLANP